MVPTSGLAIMEGTKFSSGTTGCFLFSGCADPADVSMAVGAVNGTDYALVHLNDALYVYNAVTGTQISSNTASCFWCACGNDSTQGCENGLGLAETDPRTVYDSANGRWITSAAAYGSGCEKDAEWTWLAVSKTSDPTNLDPSNWYEYKFKACGTNSSDWGDEPRLGMDNKWIVVHDSCYTQPSTLCSGGGNPVNTDLNLHVFEKSALYAGASLKVGTNQFNFVDYFEDMPAVTWTNTASGELLVRSVVPSAGGPVQEVLSQVTDGSAPSFAKAVATVSLSAVSGDSTVPDGPQPTCTTFCPHTCLAGTECSQWCPAGTSCSACISNGSECGVGTLDDSRVNSASVSTFSDGNNYILSTFAMGYPAGSNPSQSKFVLIYTRTSDYHTRAAVMGPSQVMFYPSVAMAQSTASGDLAIWGFGTATTSAEPTGNFWDFNLDTDSLEQPYTYVVCPGNTCPNTYITGGGRWGDYSSTAPDNLDPKSVYTAQQYYNGQYDAVVVRVQP